MFDHRPWIRPPTNPFTDQELLDAPTDGRHGRAVTVQRHEVLDWLGPVDLYADRAQRLEIADAILASGSELDPGRDQPIGSVAQPELTLVVQAPAPQGPVRAHPARVGAARGDLGPV